MSTGKIAIGLLAFSLALGLGVSAFAGDPAPRKIEAVEINAGDDDDKARLRRNDAVDDLVAIDDDSDDTDDGTQTRTRTRGTDTGTNGDTGIDALDDTGTNGGDDDDNSGPGSGDDDDDDNSGHGDGDDDSGHGDSNG